jgi:hypothetical protein
VAEAEKSIVAQGFIYINSEKKMEDISWNKFAAGLDQNSTLSSCLCILHPGLTTLSLGQSAIGSFDHAFLSARLRCKQRS